MFTNHARARRVTWDWVEMLRFPWDLVPHHRPGAPKVPAAELGVRADVASALLSATAKGDAERAVGPRAAHLAFLLVL